MNAAIFARLLIAALTAVALASSTKAQATGIQMLPPTNFSDQPCAGVTSGLLMWDGATPIKCVPGSGGDSNGAIGIGVQNPGAVLDIYGAGTGLNTPTSWGAMLFRATDGMQRPAVAIYGDIDGTLLADNVQGALAVRNVTGTGRSITTSASVMIGKDGSGFSLATTGSVSIGTSALPIVPFQVGNYTGMTNTIMGVADNPVGYSLELSTLWAATYVNAASYMIWGACYAGDCASDIRIKDHVRRFTPGLEALLAINPVYYRFKGLGGYEKSDRDNIGVLAQDVEKGAPELTGHKKVRLNPGDREETEIQTVNYTGLPYILINAVKEFYGKWQSDHEALVKLQATSNNLAAEHTADAKAIDALRHEIADLKGKSRVQ